MDNFGNRRSNFPRGRGGGRSWRGRGQYTRSRYPGNAAAARGDRGGGGAGPSVFVPHQTSSQRSLDGVISQTSACPYKGWHFYFPDEKYRDGSTTLRKVEIFEKYFVSWKPTYKRESIELQGSFLVDIKELQNDMSIKEAWPSLYSDVKDSPEKILACLGLAMHQMLSHDLEQEMSVLNEEALQDSGEFEVQTVMPTNDLPIIHARLVGFEPVTPLRTLKATFYGKFVSVKGTVIRVSNIKPLCIKMAFKCSTCGETQSTSLPDGKYAMPSKCTSRECRGRSFTPDRSSSLTETIDWQTIKLQELTTDDQEESGRIPRTVECELTNDIVDSCVPGDIVTVTGVVKVSSSQEGGGFKQNKDKCMFILYIHANSITNCKGRKCRSGNESADINMGIGLEFSVKDLYAVQEIQAENNLFRLLVSSLCPAIYGHEMVKAGLVLGMFGGTHKFVNDLNRIPVRGDPHILVVGDPGLGKSQMLQACANIAPRGVYVCGNTTTTSGLTVTVCKESSSADYALEAGALVLADQGCCCIDEFDKMSNQHQALLEAMEQQSISIAKAGIICSLPARASILAAANPVGGHYNKAKTVSENLKMGSALLSRFDLVFILVDKPDEELDNMLSKHVMAMHAGQKQGLYSLSRRPSQCTPTQTQQWDDLSLCEKLKFRSNDAVDPIPHHLLRKYVGYARKYVHPKLSSEGAKVLQQFYLELRRSSRSNDGTPITTRQLESLIRLSEARARLELREVATEQDAKDVVEIMKYSMIDTYSNELGFLDFKRSHHGSGMSSRSQAKKFVAALDRIAEQTSNSLFTVQQMKQLAKELNLQVRNFDDFLESLNNQNYLLKKGPRVYQLQTSGF